MKKVIIFGIGDSADIVFYYLRQHTIYEIVCFVVDSEYRKKNTFHNLPVLNFENIESFYSPDKFLFLSVIQKTTARKEKYTTIKNKGYRCINYIDPHAILNTKIIGENIFILALNSIHPYVTIGNNVSIWGGNDIGHHSIIEDHCFFAACVAIGGNVHIKEGTFVGVNATIRDNVTIGKECIIGAGAIILKDLPDYSVVSPHGTAISKIPSFKFKKLY